MVLVAVATTLWLRSREPGVGQPLVRRPFVLLVGGISAATAVVLTIGTVVTGSGPHSGDPDAGRTGLDPELVSQLHADVVFLLIGLTVALLICGHRLGILLLAALLLVWFSFVSIQIAALLLGLWLGRKEDERGQASLHTARVALVVSSGLFMLLSLFFC